MSEQINLTEMVNNGELPTQFQILMLRILTDNDICNIDENNNCVVDVEFKMNGTTRSFREVVEIILGGYQESLNDMLQNELNARAESFFTAIENGMYEMRDKIDDEIRDISRTL